jgi:Transglutaminase-like superfamily
VTARLRRILLLAPSEAALLCRAAVILLSIRLSLWMRPWNRFRLPATRTRSVRDIKPGVNRLEWAVLVASRFIPRATCLTRALALHRLLTSYGYRSKIQFGIQRSDGRFAAHAWVEHEAATLLAKTPEIARYVRLFSWPPSQPDLS